MTLRQVTLINNFSGGTSGTPVTAGNSGLPSGVPFDGNLATNGATLIYDASIAPPEPGMQACKVATSGTAGQAYVSWASSVTSPNGGAALATVYFRGLFYFPSLPSVAATVFYATGPGGVCAKVVVNPSGTVSGLDASGTVQCTTPTGSPVPTGAWWRLEGTITGAAGTGGSISLTTFNVFGSTTPTATASATGINTNAAMTGWRFGQPLAASNIGPYWMSNLGISNAGRLGPAPYGFSGLRVDGGECATMVAVPPGGGAPGNTLAIGGDVEGFWTSTDQGGHWRAADAGVYSAFMRFTACTQWSLSEASTLYSCTGNNGNGGGFQVATQDATGRWRWQFRNTTIQYASNGSNYPSGFPADPSRPTGHLLVQASASLFYTATYSQGVYKSTSSPIGETWANIGLGGGSHFCRSIAMDPNNHGNLYVGVFNEGVYLITGANTGSPAAPKLLSGSPQFPEDIVIMPNGNIYAAAGWGGAGKTGYAAGGVWASTTATAGLASGWSQLDPGGTFLSASSWWFSIDGYTDTLGGANGPYDQLVVGCNKAVKPSGATATRNIAWITVSTQTGNAVFSDLSTDLSLIASADFPPLTVNGIAQKRTNWNAGSGDALGKAGMIQPRPVIDKSTVNTSNVTIYCPGSNGFWISTGNTIGASGPTASPTPAWALSCGGMQMFIARSLTANPANPSHLLIGSSDRCAVDVADGTGYDATTTTVDSPATMYKPAGSGGNQGYGEAYALAFDALSEQAGNAGGTVYLSTGKKYSNDAGQLWARPGTTWAPADYVNISINGGTFNPGTGLGNVVYGLAGGRDGAGKPYLLAVLQGDAGTGGMYRYSGFTLNATTGAISTAGGSWAKVNGTIGTTGGATGIPNGNNAPILIDPSNPANVFCFDENSGIWRNTNYGTGTWTQIWSGINVQDPRTGYLAINPTVTAHTELWVSFAGANTGTGGGGLFYIPSADTVAPGTGSSPPSGTVTVSGIANPGGVGIGLDGTVYCIALQVPSGPYLLTQLMGSVNKGATWFAADDGDVASAASKPNQVIVTSNGRVYVGSDANVACYGYPAVPTQAPSAGMTATATMAAQPNSTGGTRFATAGLRASASMTAQVTGNTVFTAVALSATAAMVADAAGTSLVVQQVSGSSAFDYGLSSIEVSTTGGNTLVLFAGWDLFTGQTPAAMPAVYPVDSAGNKWLHVGHTTSQVSGARCAAWICPNAMAIDWLSVSLTTFASALAYTLIEFNGQSTLPNGLPAPAGTYLPPLFDLDAYDAASTAAANMIALKPGSAADTDFAFALLASGGFIGDPTVTAGWTQLTSATGGPAESPVGITPAGQIPVLPGNPNAVQIFPYYQACAPGHSLATTFTTTGPSLPLAGMVFAIRTDVAPPVQDYANFPVLKVEAGFGFSPGDPSQSPPEWTDITGRVIAQPGGNWVQGAAGHQYELAQPEAGTLEFSIDNHDGAFTPGNSSSPYYPFVVLGIPVQVSAYWQGRWYSIAYGYVERWPQEWPDLPQWGISKMVATDVIAAMAAVTMTSALDSDILIDAPYVLIPANEQYLSFSNGITGAGTVTGVSSGPFVLGSYSTADAQGLPALNYSRVNQRAGVYVDGNAAGTGGSGNAIAATGQTTNLLGSAATGFGTTAITAAPTAPSCGPGIIYTDPNLPDPVTAPGVTVSFWLIVPTQAVGTTVQPTVFTAYGTPSSYRTRPSLSVQVQNFTGHNTLAVTLADGTQVGVPFSPSAKAQQVMLIVTASALNIYVNGALLLAQGLSAAQTTAWNAASLGCPNYAYQAGGLVSGSFTAFDLAIYPGPLPAERAVAQYATGLFGQENVDATTRVAQILAWAGLGIPRGGRQTFNGVNVPLTQGPAYSLAGATAAAAVSAVAASENTMVAAMPGGALVFLHRWALLNQSPVAVFGDSTDPTAGQVPFIAGQSWGYDNTYLYNISSVTQTYGPNNLFTVTGADFGSQHDYFPRPALAQTISTMSNWDAADLMNWVIAKYGQPSLRVSTVTIDAAASPSVAFGAILPLLQGQAVTVSRSPIGGGAIVQDCLVQRIAHAIGPGKWQTAIQASPYTPENAVLQLDTPPFSAVGDVTLT